MPKKKNLPENLENQNLPPEQPESPIPEEDKPRMGDDELELIAKIESILFCIPEGIAVDVLANKLNLGLKGDVSKTLAKLKETYDAKTCGIKLIQDGDLWKFKIPDEHAELVREAAIPEFDQPILETLAYIGWRGGSRQCDVVRVRSNKAYNHIKLLKEKGFIESHKSGLSKWLQPTRKFYEYFKIDPAQKLPVPEEIEKRLQEAEKAAEEAEKAEAEKQAAQAKQNEQQVPAETKTEEIAKEAKEEDGEEPGDDEPDEGGEPEPEEQEDEENPDNE
jgi:segregation and condensation protein B